MATRLPDKLPSDVAAPKWQTMHFAPQDKDILGYDEGYGHVIMWMDEGYWTCAYGVIYPKAWMELPGVPT